jgi:hypothetical protein
MKLLYGILILLNAQFIHAQKEGTYLSINDPVCTLWELIKKDENEKGAPLAGINQQFFFLVSDGSPISMMAPYEIEGGLGPGCPTFFTVSKDDHYFYIELVENREPCVTDLGKEQKFFKVEYTLTMKNTELWLIVDSNTYRYRKWSR